MANVRFGIDHPVVTVRDLDTVRDQYRKLGFAPNPVGYHPWGTTLSLLMFKDNFIEIIAVHDASKFGTNAVDGFCYGRNVGNFTDRVEGLGLVALHSKDARADHAYLVQRGLRSQGLIDFRRDMKKPDGSPDVAVVSLGLFMNEDQRDVSNFICHQHRPELIWVPEWQNHPNGVHAVAGVTYVADAPLDLAPRYVAFYGEARVKQSKDHVETDTGCGVIRVVSPAAADKYFDAVALPAWDGTQPHGISISVRTPHFDRLEELWRANGVPSVRSPRGSWLVAPEHCGNVIMEFLPTTPD
jgi:hypothetical protein